MAFRSVRMYQFRNLEDAEISVDAPQVFLVGENGQGKSNFIEAVYLLCFGSSFRTRKDQQLIRHGERELALSARFVIDEPGTRGPENTVSLHLSGKKKEIAVNDKTISDRKDLVSNVPCIVFCHDDIEFVRGSPDMQRWFFNQTLSLFDPTFIDLLRTYGRILKLRNTLLKQLDGLQVRAEEERTLDIYDEQLAGAGVAIQARRRVGVEEFNVLFGEKFAGISSRRRNLTIRYLPSWPEGAGSDEAFAVIRDRREIDVRLGTSTSGPHRDRFSFVEDKTNFAAYASTGQLRLLSLILRVSQARYYAMRTGRRPVLLLDDVLLELDQERRTRFLDALPDYAQAFFTFLPDERYTSYRRPDTMVYRVERGRLHGVGG